MRIHPEIDGASIVLLGKFNPAIFSPSWFVLHELLPAHAETDHEGQMIVDGRVAAFRFDWLRLEVTTDRCCFETTQAPHIRIYDLVIRVFREHLHHTPLTAIGINRTVHFPVGGSTARDKLGRTLAPVDPWGEWGRMLGSNGEHGGMSSLTMSQVNPEGRATGDRINVTVGPSDRIGEGRTGVYMDVNDHFTLEGGNAGTGRRCMKLLESCFATSMNRSEGIIDHVMSLTSSGGV